MLFASMLGGRSRRSSILLVLTVLLSLPALAAENCEGIVPVSGDDITFELVSSGFASPLDVQAPPGDTDRIFVVQQRGLIRIVELATDTILPTPFINLSLSVSSSGGERGLLGLAFPADYFESGYFYVYYTRRSGGATQVSRFSVDPADPNVALPNSERPILTVSQPASNHNGGQLQFGPDGYLYIGTGDGGSGCDPFGPNGNGQNPASLLGKMLRIDVSDPIAGGPAYSIPEDNPYAAEDDGTRDEIWALGLRNPWRWSFDRETGDMYIGDVGQNAWEEIDFQPASSVGGENYGWRIREGAHLATATVSRCASAVQGPGDIIDPIWEFRHSGASETGCSVTGGVVYRGCRLPDLDGTYFYSDYCTSFIRSFKVEDDGDGNYIAVENRNWTSALNAGIQGRINEVSAFGTDGCGEVYVCDLGGQVYRIVPVSPPNNPPNAVVTSEPDPPILEIAADLVSLTLSGLESDDGDPDVEQELSYSWAKISGPEGDTIVRPSKETTLVNFESPGVFVYELTVDDGQDTDTAEITVTVNQEAPDGRFRRGDSNLDGVLDLSDGVFTLGALFLGNNEFGCEDAADSNDSGGVDLSDAVFAFNYLFSGGVEPPAPGPMDCGVDPSVDELGCEDSDSC